MKVKKIIKNIIIDNNDGMSLIEILVATSIVAIIFWALPDFEQGSSRRKIERATDALDRAIRFTSNEAIFRSTLTRLTINLDKIPIEYKVEAGPSGNFIIPKLQDINNLGVRGQKKYLKKIESLNREFNTIPESEEITSSIDEEISIRGVATSRLPNMIITGKVSIYFYPSGERDSSFIILSSSEELVTLTVEPFTNDVVDEYFSINSDNNDSNNDKEIAALSKELFEKWLKK